MVTCCMVKLSHEAKKLYTLSQPKNMNFTTVNHGKLGCGLAFLPINPESIPDLRAVSIVNNTVNATGSRGASENLTKGSHQI